MKFLVIGDIEEAEYLNALLNIDLKSYPFMVLTGDIAGLPTGWKIGRARALEDKNFIPPNKDPKEYYQELLEPNVEKLRKIDNILKKVNRYLKVFAVYGNTDFKSVVERAKPTSFDVIHNKLVEINGFYLAGYNGHPMYPWEIENPLKKDIFGYTYEETALELNSFKEEDIHHDLKSLTGDYPNECVIVVTHTPPYRILDKVKPELIEWARKSYGEKSKDGHVGSTGLRNFILEYKPILSLFGHIHESVGIEKVDGTTCVNAGKFDENKEIVEIRLERKEVKAKFISV